MVGYFDTNTVFLIHQADIIGTGTTPRQAACYIRVGSIGDNLTAELSALLIQIQPFLEPFSFKV